jgi:inorganic phosphate transporter, PiT family
MGDVSWVVIAAVAIALIFDAINGFHDAANSIATVVSTRVLSPRWAVLWAAFFNFVAMFLFAPAVANTVAKTVKLDVGDPAFLYIGIAGLIGAIIWDLLTWWWGLPTSSSHALIGGFGGAGVAYGGWDVLQMDKVMKTVEFIPLAPLIGFVLGFALMLSVYWLLRRARPTKVDSFFRRGQLVSAALYSIGHGANDAQKTMGIIFFMMMASGHVSQGETLSLSNADTAWIVISCNIAMALGTAFGGWRIVKTMGMKLTKLRPVGGFCAETAGAITLFAASRAGIPVSTTHTITGSIVGVGSTRKLSAVKWGVAARILWAWVLTIPAAAAVGAGCFYLFQYLHPDF